jgi:hypothetical protein
VLDNYKFSATPIDSNAAQLLVYNHIREKEIETVLPKELNEEVLIL